MGCCGCYRLGRQETFFKDLEDFLTDLNARVIPQKIPSASENSWDGGDNFRDSYGLKPAEGIEPPTSSLQNSRSTY